MLEAASARLIRVLLIPLLAGCAPGPSSWCQDLQSLDPFRRVMAATALGEVEAKDAPMAVDALIYALDREQADFRPRVVSSLARLSPNALPTLAAAIPTRVRGFVQRESGIQDAFEQGRDRLLPALLASIGQAAKEEDDPAVPLLAWFRAPPVAEVRALLDDPRAGMRARAASALGCMGPAASPAIPALLDRASDDGDVEVRRAAERALVGILPGASAHPGSRFDLWAKVLASEDPEQRAIARDRLCAEFASAAPALVASLADPDEGIALRAVRALAELGDCAQAASVGPALRSPGFDPALVLWATGLGDPDEDAARALRDALDDPSAPSAACASLALGRLGPRARAAEPALDRLTYGESALVRVAARLALKRVRAR
jgi:HEAT repeat protein